jgi:hypothetical protein
VFFESGTTVVLWQKKRISPELLISCKEGAQPQAALMLRLRCVSQALNEDRRG